MVAVVQIDRIFPTVSKTFFWPIYSSSHFMFLFYRS